MYFTDSHSSSKTIWSYSFDGSTGELSNRKVFFQPAYGHPDGLAVDANGDLWVALWDGWAVVQVSAQTGEVLQTIEMPVARPTCPCFGGRDFDELFVTSAASDDDGEPVPGGLVGAVFRIRVGVQGSHKGRFRLS